MKKNLILVAAAALLSLSLSAQGVYRTVGDKSIDLGVGLGGVKIGSGTIVPPVRAAFEYTLLEQRNVGTVSVGGVINYRMDKEAGESFSVVYVGPQVVYRYPVLEKVDLFAKLSLGYLGFASSSAIVDYYVKDLSGFAWSANLGAMYYFSDKMGVGLQFGRGLSTAEVFLSIRL